MKQLSIPLFATVLAVAACGSDSKSTPTTAPKIVPPLLISSKHEPGLGTVLVDAQGRTLYQFVRDNAKAVTCTGSCARVWIPVILPAGAPIQVGGSVQPSLLGSGADPAGGRVVTYAGWPLYTYASDAFPGAHTGQGINSNGGLWYVMSTTGKPIK